MSEIFSKKEECFAFVVDLEEVFDQVPRDVAYWVLMKLSIEECLLKIL